MDVTNDSPFAHALAIGMGPDRQAALGVVVKATFRLPERAGTPVELAGEQQPVATGDDYHKGDVTGSVRTASEAVVYKPRADVLLIGQAVAPGGRAVTEMDVHLRVGALRQTIRVVGDRRWIFPTRLAVVPVASAPEPFVAMPLVYERAFGGHDLEGRSWSRLNPIGRGFIAEKTRDSVDGRALPNLEDPRCPVRSWDDAPDPVGWGVFGQAWQPRAALVGTGAPDADFGLPAGFDHGFFNVAHPALQVPFLVGDEEVELHGVTAGGARRFRLPGRAPAAEIQTRGGAVYPFAMALDTLALFPDDGVFTLTWRAHRPVAGAIEAALAHVEAIRVSEVRGG